MLVYFIMPRYILCMYSEANKVLHRDGCQRTIVELEECKILFAANVTDL